MRGESTLQRNDEDVRLMQQQQKRELKKMRRQMRGKEESKNSEKPENVRLVRRFVPFGGFILS